MNGERRNDCDDKGNIYDDLLRAHYRDSVATGVEQTEEVVHHIAYAYYDGFVLGITLCCLMPILETF
jgi:hypothetical protein